ncbi:cyclic GMP-AMP synthase-like receptor 1 [Lissotriton helveticus]
MDAPWRSTAERRRIQARLERLEAILERLLARRENPWGELPAKTLSDFLRDCVLIPRAETSEALQRGVLPEVERVLALVHRLDARFGPHFQRSGSYIEGLKVSEPDEFDFLVPLNGLDEGSLTPGSSPVALPPAAAASPDGSFLALTLGGPCYNWPCGPCWAGGKRAPASLCSWRQHDVPDPPPSGEWLLKPQKVMDAFEQSVSDALSGEPASCALLASVRYSFSRIERELLEKIDEDGGRRRDSLRILKKVREDLWKPKYGKVLVSYHLKTVLFWACEENPLPSDWNDLTVSFVRLVDYLVVYLQKGNLPHYFLGSDVNLFKPEHRPRLPELLDDVNKFKTSPMKYLK